MTNEELNTALYEKMFAEQQRYREWLLSQPPDEILNHCYEFTVREDIVLALEYHDLSDKQCKALLQSRSPLADVFKDFEKRETDHRLSDFKGVNMLCDIGNGTMNIMFINDKKPVPGNMFTEKFGTHQCLLAARENVMRVHHTTVDDAIINRVFRFGTADINEKYLKTITDTAAEYVEGIFQRLREHEYNPELMRLYVLGGGSCLIRNFGIFDKERVTINDDICATAKGYEYLSELNVRRSGQP